MKRCDGHNQPDERQMRDQDHIRGLIKQSGIFTRLNGPPRDQTEHRRNQQPDNQFSQNFKRSRRDVFVEINTNTNGINF